MDSACSKHVLIKDAMERVFPSPGLKALVRAKQDTFFGGGGGQVYL